MPSLLGSSSLRVKLGSSLKVIHSLLHCSRHSIGKMGENFHLESFVLKVDDKVRHILEGDGYWTLLKKFEGYKLAMVKQYAHSWVEGKIKMFEREMAVNIPLLSSIRRNHGAVGGW